MDGPVIRPVVWKRPAEEKLRRFWVCLTFFGSLDPAAENTCERLIGLALETDANNVEALQTLASVRLSQQRPEEAREYLEKAWSGWKDLDLGAEFRRPSKTVPLAYDLFVLRRSGCR